ncbi:MAG: hypothetical protein IJS66_06320 [Bacteroidales bacterium]|nr:hypothetical protein [Bacteroidales bacterium]
MKRWTQFLLCFLLSAGIWLVHNLSHKYSGVVNVPVVAHTSLLGYSEYSRGSVSVSARCQATGFRLLRLNHSSKTVTVTVNPEDFTPAGDGVFTISAAELVKYVPAIFGEDVTLLAFLSQNFSFSFDAETFRTVAVKPVYSASFSPQYMADGPVKLHPDSVTVYGNPLLLSSVNEVLTKPFATGELDNGASGVVRLSQPSGLRLSMQEVAWSLDVVRFVEVRTRVKPQPRNVPSGIEFSLYPPVAEAVLKCRFPLRSDPSSELLFYVDYNEFETSPSGRCIARCDSCPTDVLEYTLEPEVFDCIAVEEERR